MMGSSGTARSCSRRLALFLVSLLGHCSYFFLSFSHALPYTYTPGHLMGISGATGAEHNPLSLFLPTSFFTNFPPLGKCWFLSSPLTQLSMQKQILQLYLEDEACVVCFAKQASVVADSLQPCGLPGFSVYGDFPGKNTGMGCLPCPHPGDLSDAGISLHWQ